MRKLVTAMVLGTALVGFAIGCSDSTTNAPVIPKKDYTTTTLKSDKPKADESTTSTTKSDSPTTTTAAPTAKPL